MSPITRPLASDLLLYELNVEYFMGKSKSNTRTTLAILSTAFVVIGTYNSVVINSDEFMDHRQVRYVKRLDEVYGIVKPGREMANYGRWTKLASAPKKFISAIAVPTTKSISPSIANAETVVDEVVANNAAIKEELNLELKEVFNARKYPNPPKVDGVEVKGSLTAFDGEIRSISVTLPGGESFSVSDEAMTGNVFQYQGSEGEELSGMIYQMDKTSYMVTLTNGPMEGTRLKFNTVQEEDFGNNSAAIAENNYATEPESTQAEEAPAFEPVVSDNGESTPVGQFGTESSAPAVVEAAPGVSSETTVAQNVESGQSFDEQAQQAAGQEQMANGGQGFNFNDQAATL